ncbi:YdcF family protein [Microvirga sp. 3-52]|jgi:hypothetical protein|uniref:YdcF family protein n=1 Tax=Microvirga sp. 3-52 TaxID=2792425 RepID=UPI001BD01887|nr:YdcF family protein [Microvirga sp. 3-52]MBS7454766.1 YdcF family protein [Microvirga sp. 3-52]
MFDGTDMDQDTPRLAPLIVAALNDVAGLLALNDFGPKGADGLPEGIATMPIDCIILSGNCVLETAEGAFRLVRGGICPRLLISGGIGHATEVLRRKVAAHPVYRSVPTEGRAEACILTDIAMTFWGVDRSSLLVESDSTNSGENARFSRKLLEDAGEPLKTILLVQDPTMQRRADATFRHTWSDRSELSFLSWPTFTPRVCLMEGELRFALNGIAGPWSMDRFLALVMGEIPRLRNDSHGYGLNGKGYIAHVDIPEHIQTAFARLQDGLAGDFQSRLMPPHPLWA